MFYEEISILQKAIDEVEIDPDFKINTLLSWVISSLRVKESLGNIITIKLNCDVLDPDKLIVITLDKVNANYYPQFQEILRDAFPDIQFLIVDSNTKVQEFDKIFENLNYQKQIRENLEERLRKY